jgi:hypothetical protein
MKINTLDELIVYAGDVVSKRKKYEAIELKSVDLSFTARIEGDGWGRRVDARLARYLLSLQDSFDDLLDEFGPEEYPVNPPRVLMEVKEGSSLPEVDISSVLSAVVTNMTPENTFISTMVAIAAATGGYVWARWRTSKEAMANNEERVKHLEMHEKTKLEAINALRSVAETNAEKFQIYEKPAKVLVSTMEKDDVISFAGGDEMEKEEARRAMPKRLPRAEKQTTYADGEYVLDDINYSHGEVVLLLSQDGIPVKAHTTQLSNEDSDALFSDIYKRQAVDELPLSVKIQMNIHHTSRKIQYGSIVGVGEPRDGKVSKKISLILK